MAVRYRLIGKKGEGTFSEVLKAQGIKNGKYVAIKCMKNHFDSLDQVQFRSTSGPEVAFVSARLFDLPRLPRRACTARRYFSYGLACSPRRSTTCARFRHCAASHPTQA